MGPNLGFEPNAQIKNLWEFFAIRGRTVLHFTDLRISGPQTKLKIIFVTLMVYA